MIQLTWWELEELESRWLASGSRDLWREVEDAAGKWIRWVDRSEQEIAFTLQIIPAPQGKRFGMGELHVIPHLWSDALEYMRLFCLRFTTLQDRMDCENLLRDEFQFTPERAHLAAIIISHVYLVGNVTIEPTTEDTRVTDEYKPTP